jgi:myosin-5
MHRYYMLTPSRNWGPEIEQLCALILSATIKEADRYQTGETKIFFRAGMLAQLEKQRTDRLNALATLIQKNLRRHVHATRYRNLRATVIGIQTAWRRLRAQRAAEEARRQKAALEIQRVARGHLERIRYLRTRRAIVSLQSGERALLFSHRGQDPDQFSVVRGQRARRNVREIRFTNAATLLQSLFRGLCARLR